MQDLTVLNKGFKPTLHLNSTSHGNVLKKPHMFTHNIIRKEWLQIMKNHMKRRRPLHYTHPIQSGPYAVTLRENVGNFVSVHHHNGPVISESGQMVGLWKIMTVISKQIPYLYY